MTSYDDDPASVQPWKTGSPMQSPSNGTTNSTRPLSGRPSFHCNAHV